MPSTARGPFLNSRTRPSTSMPLSARHGSDPSELFAASNIFSCNNRGVPPSPPRKPGRCSGASSAPTSRAAWRSSPRSASPSSRRWRSATSIPDEPLPMSALAGALQCDNSNMTGIVDRLEAAGLAERRPGGADRRVKTVVLTRRRGRRERGRRRARRRPRSPRSPRRTRAVLRDVLQRALAGAGGAQRPLTARAARADVLGGRPDQPRLALLLEDVRRPAGGPRAGEHAREQDEGMSA